VPHRDHEPRPDQHGDVAGVDDLRRRGQLVVLDVARGAQHEAGDVADRVDRGPVPRVDRLLDDQLVQAEDLADRPHGGPVGLVQPEPDEGAALAASLPGRLGEMGPLRPAAARGVDPAVDDRVGVGAALGGQGAPVARGDALDEPA
jgi:hypothetical protein